MSWIDELERDLGQAAALRLIANAGGQRRWVPYPGRVRGSKLETEFGPTIASWLSGRYGGDRIDVPSRYGRDSQNQANRLRAAVLEAGLITPTVSADDLALRFGVTARRIYQLRCELRRETTEPLPLFDYPEALQAKSRR